MSIILKARGIQEISRDKLFSIQVPEQTYSYCPISNREIVETTLEELDKGNYNVKSEFHRCDGSHQKFVGGFLISSGDSEMDIMFGYKNSYDRSMSAAFALGANIMICSNSVVTGEVSMIRRHTGNGNLIITEGIKLGLEKLWPNFETIQAEMKRMKEIETSKRICSELCGRLFIEHEIITAHQLAVVKKEFEVESFNYGVKDSLYNLYQAVTLSLKKSHPSHWLQDHLDAHEFFVNAAGELETSTPLIPEPVIPLPEVKEKKLSWLDEL